MKSKVVVCASGDGSNFEALVRASREGQLDAEIVGLIASRPKIGALGRADRLSLPRKIIAAKDTRGFLTQLKEWQADWIVLAGYLSLIGPEILRAFPKRIVNSHPALLPKFGGAGMYGNFVHAAVLKAQEVQTGITVHLIDEVYDQGQILAQQVVNVEKNDSVATLAQRVKRAEHIFYPKVLHDVLCGKITVR